MDTVILSRDPGQKPGHVAMTWAGEVSAICADMEAWVTGTTWDLACTESQWWFPEQDVDPNRLFGLAFEAGWSLRGIPARRYMRIPPKEWRGGSNAAKDQLQRHCARELTPSERKLFAQVSEKRHGDILDAIMIGRAAIRIARAVPPNTKFDWPPVAQPRKPRASTRK